MSVANITAAPQNSGGSCEFRSIALMRLPRVSMNFSAFPF